MRGNEKGFVRFWLAEVCFVITIAIILFKCYDDYTLFKQMLAYCMGALVVGTILNLLLWFIMSKLKK